MDMGAFAFITAFRSRRLARDWNYHVWLLERTLDSMLSQTHEGFFIIVVCHEIPQVCQAKHPKVHFLSVDFAPPQRENDDMCVDKVLKLSVGAEWALAKGCRYVMFTDADDLVSRRIVAFAAEHDGANGWFTSTEFFYAYGSRWIRYNSRGAMNSGPGIIVRSDLLKFEAPPFAGCWVDFVVHGGEENYVALLARRKRRVNTLAAAGLGHFQTYMSAEGYPLEPLPFAAYTMINHVDSTSQVPGGLGTVVPDRADEPGISDWLHSAKAICMSLRNVRPITRRLRREFRIPTRNHVPPAHRGKGSMFLRDIQVRKWLSRAEDSLR